MVHSHAMIGGKLGWLFYDSRDYLPPYNPSMRAARGTVSSRYGLADGSSVRRGSGPSRRHVGYKEDKEYLVSDISVASYLGLS